MANVPVAGDSRIVRLFESRIFEIKERILADLSAGIPIDFASYKDLVGYLRGLEDALNVLKDIQKGID